LLTPFGWAAQLLAGMVDAEPDLLAHVFELDRQRMHVITLALAPLDGNPPPQLGPVLLRGSARDLLPRVLGRSPVGIKRVLRRLPFAVLSQLSYRRLVQLLDDPQATKLLHHLPDALRGPWAASRPIAPTISAANSLRMSASSRVGSWQLARSSGARAGFRRRFGEQSPTSISIMSRIRTTALTVTRPPTERPYRRERGAVRRFD
jgi:hypothetical protein